MSTNVKLTFEQENAMNAIVHGIRRRDPVQTLGGYAGTGKTTIISELVRDNPEIAVCAFTGKAANVLTRKGVKATTIHRLIYEARKDKLAGQVRFIKKTSLPCPVIIVDEASMVGRELHDHLTSFGKPVVYVGDHGQLEPVGSREFNLMREPQHRLETIHRNAGEISRFAEWVRNGNEATRFPCEKTGQVRFFGRRSIRGTNLEIDVDQIVCAFNRTRVWINEYVRAKVLPDAAWDGVDVARGDRVICLRNNHSIGVFNGMQAVVTNVVAISDAYLLDLDSYGETFAKVPAMPDQFGELSTPPFNHDPRVPFDYSYCVTCHKAQGDEWDSVMVLEQRCDSWDHRRWAYTAASRAREQVVWVTGF